MAVLDVDAATEDMVHDASARVHQSSIVLILPGDVLRPMQTVGTLATQPLPEDIRRHECTTAVLFRGSLILNYLTGGRADMTFSARCFRSQRLSRNIALRLAWRTMMHGIDLACALLRGESRHCATAWSNYLARPARRTR